MDMNYKYPKIGVVVIGINVERHLQACLESVFASDYPTDFMEVVYVDSGSSDSTVPIARSFGRVRVIKLNDQHPTPGKGRNAGWKSLDTPFIQFLDADTVIHPKWLKTGVTRLRNNVRAVCGQRQERYPATNWFHRIVNMEWDYEIGPCRYFGGDVLMARSVLEETDGFDEALVAGEDPELSYRIRQKGYVIQRLRYPMTEHDINMRSFRQYLKRAVRSGYAYAEIALRFLGKKEKMWKKELIRVLVRGFLPVCLLLIFASLGWPGLGLVLGGMLLMLPLVRIKSFRKRTKCSWIESMVYSLHCSFVVIPQCIGVLRYGIQVLGFPPMRNKGLHQPNVIKVSL